MAQALTYGSSHGDVPSFAHGGPSGERSCEYCLQRLDNLYRRVLHPPEGPEHDERGRRLRNRQQVETSWVGTGKRASQLAWPTHTHMSTLRSYGSR